MILLRVEIITTTTSIIIVTIILITKIKKSFPTMYTKVIIHQTGY